MPFHVKIKLALKKVLPYYLFARIVGLWRHTLAPLFTHETLIAKYYDTFVVKYGLIVQGGPFKGMDYIDESAGSVLFHKLVGYYEEILHDTINSLRNKKIDTIIDIGCAEGYYLAGLGREFKEATLVGYDTDEHALGLTRQLIEKNHLPNHLILKTACTPKKLNEQITNNTIIICDAEGFEAEILDPVKIPALAKVAHYIIETHEFVVPDVIAKLTERFAPTHNITPITFKLADVAKYPFLQTITNQTDLYYLRRERGEQEQVWLILEKKSDK